MGLLYANRQDQQGFTLIELLVVIGILVVLLSVTLVAINPARQFSQTNNTKRRSDIRAILNAITQYTIDNAGIYPATITTSPLIIKKSGGIDLCSLLVPTYIPALPADPKTNGGALITDCSSNYDTNYTVFKTAASARTSITVSAPAEELSASINVTQ